LIVAAESANTSNNETAIRMLLKAGADPNACSVNPIIAAIKAKNYKAMRAFYENGVAPSVSEEH
jgi:hypothetical protein